MTLSLKDYPFKNTLAVSLERRFIFLRNPKTATQSLTRHFSHHVKDLRWKKNGQRQLKEWIESGVDLSAFFIFGFCRHPVDRFISACNFVDWPPETAIRHVEEGTGKTFARLHFIPQHKYLPFGKIYRFENVNDAISEICERTGVPKNVEKRNVSEKKYSATPGIEETIKSMYAEDYRRFGYNKNVNNNLLGTKNSNR